MQRHTTAGRIVRFGSFEVDLQEGRLTRSGLRVRLQGQPFQILALLLEHPGEVVSREEIRHRLWSEQTFVEFDDALNTAIRKLRAALGDSADNPRFLETVPRRGYRFVAPVTLPPGPLPVQAVSEDEIERSPAAPVLSSPSRAAPKLSADGRWRRLVLPGAVVLLAMAAAGAYWRIHHPAFRVTTRDTIVLADFVNTTGETVFDESLRQGLEIGLGQSPNVKILPDRKASLLMKQMARAPEERITGKLAIEVCQRASGKVTVQGSIASLGNAYLVGLAAIRCDNGEPIANEQAQARRREDVVDALGRAAAQLRSRLGESLPSIQKYNAPLELATTASLDALNTYGLALSTWDRQGDSASLPVFKKAVELDPNFALAYDGLATIYHNIGETGLSRASATRAYELRGATTRTERLLIEARYYAYVTGELERTAEVRAQEVQSYPESAGAYNHLGNIDGELGRYEQSEQELRHALLLDPTRAATYANLSTDLFALNRVEEGAAVLAEAARHNLHADALLQSNYWLAFLTGDNGQMRRLEQQAAGQPEVQAAFFAEQANTEAFSGHYTKARDLARNAADLAVHRGDSESAASFLVQEALREAEIGNRAGARQLVADAEKLSHGQEVTTLAALTLARTGDFGKSEEHSQQLSKQWPVGTYTQKYWLPVIRAQTGLEKSQPAMAVDVLQAVLPPLEFACPPSTPVATMYPAYLRGKAYLAAGDGARAQQEFKKMIDHKGLTVNYPLGSLAYVWLARSYVRTGDTQKAREAYQDFFALWKDADANLAVLKEAKTEAAKLY